MSHGYGEDALVKQAAVELLEELGWDTVGAYGEFGRPGADGRSALGRETEAEVVLTARLRPALVRLNPEASGEAVEDAGEETERVRVIDWSDPANNDLLLCSEFWVAGEMYRCRADLLGFVNGMPLLFVELKAAHRRLELAYDGI